MKTNHFFAALLATIALILLCPTSNDPTFENLAFQGQWANGNIPGWTAISYPYELTPGDPGGNFTAASDIFPNDQGRTACPNGSNSRRLLAREWNFVLEKEVRADS